MLSIYRIFWTLPPPTSRSTRGWHPSITRGKKMVTWAHYSASSPLLHRRRNPYSESRPVLGRATPRSRAPSVAMPVVCEGQPTKLVTFLGKGGSGKTTAAVLAAQYYAKEGHRTCLVLHSQDKTAEDLMGCKLGESPVTVNENLSAVRLETTKMILEPLNRMKKADSQINLTQGILEGVVGEELGVLPGMDSIFSVLEVEKKLNFLGRKRKYSNQVFDIIVYDGISTEETLRMIGATEVARRYVKYIRNLAEKTDIGRLSAPSLLKLMQESLKTNGSSIEGKMSYDIWDDIEQSLQRATSTFTDPSRFRCYLVTDPSRPTSINSALRYWGCAIQAGAHVSGAFGFVPQSSTSATEVAAKFSPLDFAFVPYISTATPINWDMAVSALSDNARNVLGSSSSSYSSVRFDYSKKTVTLFMPGFDKSEIKLYQYRGGAELLVEAGDQRRIIQLPSGLQGKVGGAKFLDSSLVVILR